MAELATIFTSLRALLKIVELGQAYHEVSADIQKLIKNIEITDRKIHTAKRLRRVKSAYLDQDFKDEVDADIQAAEETVDSIGQTIERCRADLETNNQKVKPLNKVRWLHRDRDDFLEQGYTLGICLAALNSDIARLDAASLPPAIIEPPSYQDAVKFTGQLRSPTQRRRLARQRSSSSMASFGMSTATPVEAPASTSVSDVHIASTLSAISCCSNIPISNTANDQAIDSPTTLRAAAVETSWSDVVLEAQWRVNQKTPVVQEQAVSKAARPRRNKSACIG